MFKKNVRDRETPDGSFMLFSGNNDRLHNKIFICDSHMPRRPPLLRDTWNMASVQC